MTDRLNIRELLARLNPANCRFDVGNGGLPTLTNIDIAGALGMVPNGIGRELLIHLHWPEGSRVDRKRLMETVAGATRAEMSRRDERLRIARLAVHIELERWAERAHHTEQDRRDLANARRDLESMRAVAWPHDPEMHARLRHAVLEEMAAPNLCRECQGRGSKSNGALVVMCMTCSGRGVVPVSDRQRADRLSRDESSYRKSWRGMYEWLWRMLTAEEQRAAEALATAIGWGKSAAA